MICTYCGDTADSLDHFIPHSYAQKNGEPKSFARSKTIPACRECNCILGTRLFYSIGERAAYLKDRYLSRYKKILSTPEWDDEELEDMGYNMRMLIETSQEDKRAIQYRVAHCETVAAVSPTPEEVWAAHDERLASI